MRVAPLEDITMPNCFQLISKDTKLPVALARVDEAICKHVGVIPHEDKWFKDWYNYIGFALACGKTFPQIKKLFDHDDEIGEVIAFLDTHYTVDAWAEIGRR
jgi:hypothetical protein